MAKLLLANGTITEIQPENGTDFQLDELRKLIGCQFVEITASKNCKILISDEEALCRGDIVEHPVFGLALEEWNTEATKKVYKPYLNRLATMALHPAYEPFAQTVLCGAVILCEDEEFK